MAGKGGVAKGMTLKKLQHLPSSKSKPQSARSWLLRGAEPILVPLSRTFLAAPAPSALLEEEREPSKEWAEGSPDPPNSSAASPAHAVVLP